MNNEFHIGSEDEDQWLEGLEAVEDDPEMSTAVRIQDPISSLSLASPLIAEIGTSLKNALHQLQQEKLN